MASLDQFSARMKQIAAAIPVNANALKRRVALAILQPVVLGTPVGNPVLWKTAPPKGYVGGRARGNWFVAIGSPVLGVTDETDAGGSATISKGNQEIQSARSNDVIYLTNNLPYIVPLNEGHSHQAPIGFIETAIHAGILALNGQKIVP